jgi:hypothetical protein
MVAFCSLLCFRDSVGADMDEFANKLRVALETQHTPSTDLHSRTKIQLKHPRAAHVAHANQLVSIIE